MGCHVNQGGNVADEMMKVYKIYTLFMENLPKRALSLFTSKQGGRIALRKGIMLNFIVVA
ncbi:hypothetical protein VI03_18735 [Burkholderia vietnamiensis]|nr:hypothetical protein VI03_18735 [Burkholderia vietnamiensis]